MYRRHQTGRLDGGGSVGVRYVVGSFVHFIGERGPFVFEVDGFGDVACKAGEPLLREGIGEGLSGLVEGVSLPLGGLVELLAHGVEEVLGIQVLLEFVFEAMLDAFALALLVGEVLLPLDEPLVGCLDLVGSFFLDFGGDPRVLLGQAGVDVVVRDLEPVGVELPLGVGASAVELPEVVFFRVVVADSELVLQGLFVLGLPLLLLLLGRLDEHLGRGMELAFDLLDTQASMRVPRWCRALC